LGSKKNPSHHLYILLLLFTKKQLFDGHIEMHAQLHQSHRFKDCHVHSIVGDADSHPGCFEQLQRFSEQFD
jgi:hypothetical protein